MKVIVKVRSKYLKKVIRFRQNVFSNCKVDAKQIKGSVGEVG